MGRHAPLVAHILIALRSSAHPTQPAVSYAHPRRGLRHGLAGQAVQRSASEGALRPTGPQAAQAITCRLQAATTLAAIRCPTRAAAWQHARGRMGSREGAGSRTLCLRQPGRCGPSWAGRRCRICTLSGRCCSFLQRSTLFNPALRLTARGLGAPGPPALVQ
jgi:hypothetical protein